jgi:hypothetical protein
VRRRNLRNELLILFGGNFATGQFAIFRILLIMIDFIPLAVGLAKSKEDFQSKSIKITVLIWLVMLIIGIILILIP